MLAAIATYPLRLIEVAREEGFDFRTTLAPRRRPRLGDVVGRAAGADRAGDGHATFDIIGMTETGGPGLGIDCAARAGIHVWDDHYLPEIVDPETGAS